MNLVCRLLGHHWNAASIRLDDGFWQPLTYCRRCYEVRAEAPVKD